MADIVTLDEYAALERPNIRFLVPDLIPKPGLILLLGEAGAGKSFLALQIAFAIAQGGMFFGTRASQGRVLYYQFDMSEMVVRQRVEKLKASGVDVTGPIYTLHPATAPKGINILRPEYYSILADGIKKADPDIIIFDVLREMHNADEDDSSEMKVVGDTLTALVGDRCGLILHHPKKIANGLEPKVIDSSRGSSYLPGKVDAVWLLHDGYFHIGKSRFAEGGKYRAKRLANGLWNLGESK